MDGGSASIPIPEAAQARLRQLDAAVGAALKERADYVAGVLAGMGLGLDTSDIEVNLDTMTLTIKAHEEPASNGHALEAVK